MQSVIVENWYLNTLCEVSNIFLFTTHLVSCEKTAPPKPIETTVSKCMDNSRYNAFVDINLERFGWNVSYSEKCYRCYLNVPTWDRME